MQQKKKNTELFENLIHSHIKTNRGGFLFVQTKKLQGSSSTIHSSHCTFHTVEKISIYTTKNRNKKKKKNVKFKIFGHL